MSSRLRWNSAKYAKFPVIKCLPRDDGDSRMMRFWCPFCKKWHLHGIGDGHRTSHCVGTNSPYKEHGYVICMMSKRELISIKGAIEKYLEQAKPKPTTLTTVS